MARYRVQTVIRGGVVDAFFDDLASAAEYLDRTAPERDWNHLPSIHRIDLCPHDMPYEECDACMIQSDLAYDADREDRFFGKGR